MIEQETHPKLEEAYQRGLPEVYLPTEVIANLKGQELMFDDYNILSLGFRISPKGIRSLILSYCNGMYDEDGYFPPAGFHARTSAMTYGLFNDLISDKEFTNLAKGKKIEGNLVVEPKELYISPNHPAIGNIVMDSLDTVAIDIERRRRENPNIVVVLFHGKWNNVPHPGHILASRDVLNHISFKYKVDHKDFAVVVACENNHYITSAGKMPFLNTLWRVSLMSYLPYADYICPSGRYNLNKVDAHWYHKYNILRPDFINIDPDHPRKEFVIQGAKEAGATCIENPRMWQWIPELYKPLGQKVEKAISTSRIHRGDVDRWSFEMAVHETLRVKSIRDELFGPRRWFVSSNLLLLDRARGLVPETFRPAVQHPNPEFMAKLSGAKGVPSVLKAPRIENYREVELRAALRVIGV